jgi:ComEC/Rec2-related protein
MGILEKLTEWPRRFSLPVAAAIGLGLGFYPDFIPLPAMIAMAIGIASFGIALRALNGQGVILYSLFVVCAGAGAAAGAMASAVEKACMQPNAHGPGDSTASTISLRWIEGWLVYDSSPAKNGLCVYTIRADRLGISGASCDGEISFPDRRRGPEYRILVRNGKAFDRGVRIRAEGRPGDGAVLFAQARDIHVLDPGGILDRMRGSVRSACRSALARSGSVSAGLLEALLLGVRDNLGTDEAEAFKAAGCSHILALSGEHLSVLALVAVAALSPLLGPIKAKLGGAVLATFFLWIAGAGASLLRAVLMAWIGAIAALLDRPQSALTILSIAFAAMLVLDPGSARTLSFILSYAAVWGLAVLGPRFEFLLGKRLPPFLCGPVSVALSAQTAVSPVLIVVFGSLQPAAVPASVAAGPLVAAMMWWGVVSATMCSILPAAANLVVPVSDALYRVLMTVIEGAASVPPLVAATPIPRAALIAAVVLIAAAVYARPYAEYRKARLRLADRPARLSRSRVPGDVQALRPEFSDQPPPAGTDPRGTRRTLGLVGLGDRPRHREYDRCRPG